MKDEQLPSMPPPNAEPVNAADLHLRVIGDVLAAASANLHGDPDTAMQIVTTQDRPDWFAAASIGAMTSLIHRTFDAEGRDTNEAWAETCQFILEELTGAARQEDDK